jgi:hypothetical protein
MAVLLRAEMQGVRVEQMRPYMDWVKARIRSFPGFIALASGPIPGGMQVTSVWETEAAHQRWLDEVAGPMAIEQPGVTEPPLPQYLPLDAFITRSPRFLPLNAFITP